EYERNSPRMSSNSYVNLKIATCLVRYADDRLIDQRFLRYNALHPTARRTTTVLQDTCVWDKRNAGREGLVSRNKTVKAENADIRWI
ncbi:hypothetical protein, partial [Burkholderia multivorans]